MVANYYLNFLSMKSRGSKSKSTPKPKTTSWGSVASWYDDHLEGEDTYHANVIRPNLERWLLDTKDKDVLDLACGEGYFSRMLQEMGARVTGADIAAELIDIAKSKSDASFYVAPAENLSFAQNASFDAILCVLALQNMERIEDVFAECARVLRSDGKFVFVLNHPAFRIPKRSAWGFDAEENTQYRRIDGYLSASQVTIDLSPGRKTGEATVSVHRSLQDYMKALSRRGFAVTKLEEWISHKESEKGPRKEAEDRARKEFPLFLTVEARRIYS